MRPRRFLLPALIALAAPTVFAATFVVPPDREMVRRAPAIVRGNVLDSFSELTASGSIQTITEVRITEVLKGSLLSGSLVRVASIGGALGSRALVVPGSPKFADGEDVLLFLTPGRDGTWSTVDLTLGKFTRAVSTRGDTLLVRDDQEIFGWDVDGAPHREPVRLAEPFVRFVREVAVGGAGVENYFAPPATVFPRPKSNSVTLAPAPLAAFPAATYVMTVTLNSITRPVRWPSFGSGIAFRNFGTQSGAPNGGIDSIVAGTGMWTNDCASNVNYSYGGSTGSTQCLNTQPDGIHGVGFNDPCGEIPGSFSGSGILGQGGFWVSSSTNSIEGTTFWNITEGNVVLQDNLQVWSHVGEAAYMNALMAHELGHTLGFRHSDQNSDGGACAPASMECSSAAVMKASLTTAYTALQTWDVNAVGAVYPGGTCGGGPRRRADFNGNGTSDIWWRHSSTGENSIWYISGNAFAGGATPPAVAPVAVFTGVGDFNNDGRSDVLWRNSSTGAMSIWFLNGGAIIGGLTLPTVTNTNVIVAGVGDFNGDGYADILWRDRSTGANSIWFITASGFAGGANPPTVADGNMNVAAVADFNGNGTADIFWRNSVTGAAFIWLMSGGTLVGGSTLPTIPVTVTFAGTGDFNGDGSFDLVWRNAATGESSIWYIVNGNFVGGATLPTVPGVNLRIAAIGDFNADGLYDLLWRNDSSGDNSIWYLNGGTIIGGVTLPRITVPELQIVAPKG